MRTDMLRWTPALLFALLMLAAGSADAHALDDIIQCVHQGPNGCP